MDVRENKKTVWETNGPLETSRLAYCLGQQAQPGQVYGLDGDLGAGKTVFAQGFASGLGIEGPVNIPYFTIMHQYED